MEALFIQNDKGKWRWAIPREGPDVTPLNRFDSKEDAQLDFVELRNRLSRKWIRDLDAALADRSASELIIETKREKIRGLRRWLFVLGVALLSQAVYIVTLLR